jgi:hypothetical protein
MWSLAVNCVLAGAILSSGDQELKAFSASISRQVATISNGFSSTGVGALISPEGLFMAHQSGLPRGPMITGVIAGQSFLLSALAEDKETGMTLLQASPWRRTWGDPIRVGSRPSAKGDHVFVMTIEGLRRSTVSDDQRVGQVRPSLRYVPLAELRLEEKRADVTGAVAFSPSGDLVGILSGSVSGLPAPEAETAKGAGFALSDTRPQYGPGGLEVGFAYGPVLLERVVQGFLSKDRKVLHPSIGVFFRQSSQQGAVLEVVMPRSPAAQAGLIPGDVITSAGGKRIAGPIDLAAFLFDQRVGEVLSLSVKRGQATLEVSVKVGVQGTV